RFPYTTLFRSALARQFEGDGLADAARSAGHEGDLVFQFHSVLCLSCYWLIAASTRSSDAWSTRASPASTGSMRLAMPIRVLLGAHSITWVTPLAAIFCMVSTQRTGPAAWRTSASLIRAGSFRIATSTLLIKSICGALKLSLS